MNERMTLRTCRLNNSHDFKIIFFLIRFSSYFISVLCEYCILFFFVFSNLIIVVIVIQYEWEKIYEKKNEEFSNIEYKKKKENKFIRKKWNTGRNWWFCSGE